MALKVGELEADITLEDSKFDKGMDGAKSKFGGFAKGLAKSGALLGLAAGVALAGAIVAGASQAMDATAANDKLAGQLALTGPESERIGKVAGKLYSGAYGDSLEEVNVALKGVITNVDGMRGASNEAVQDATKKVMNLGAAFDQDVGETSRAVGKLIKNGLAKDATEALDLLTKGFQSGADEAGDLLDTVNEYSTQFREAGLSGQEAMGLLSQGLQAGARDADTVADAIKEFEIRARDGSKTTADGFKGIGLNAKHMADEIAAGGPRSKAALDLTLDSLRKIHDPVKRDALAVELFGTKAEDLGDALYALDPSKAVASLGQVKGAADELDSTLSGNAKTSLEAFKRSIMVAFQEKIGPIIEKFASWLAGPGKYEIANAFLEIGIAVTGLVSTFGPAIQFIDGLYLDFVQSVVNGAAEAFGWIPGIGPKLKSAQEKFTQFRDVHDRAFDGLIEKSGEWNTSLKNLQTEVKLKADISNWETQLKAAKTQVTDKNLTAERKATLKANIADLEQKIRTAKGQLAQPELVATKVAKLQADKKTLDDRIAAAKKALNDPKLTATKKAKLTAEIGALQAAVNAAQTKINSLTGKTVTITYWQKILGTAPNPSKGVLAPGRAAGGPVYAGQAYVVGEHRRELFVPGQDGMIVPSVPTAWNPTAMPAGRGGWAGPAATPLQIILRSGGSQLDELLMQLLRRAIRLQGGNVQAVLGSGRA